MTDLSHVFDNPDTEEAQADWHKSVTPDLHLHLSKAVNHHLGLSDDHPGKFKGPPLPNADAVPTDWSDPESQFQSGQKREAEAIDNLSQGGPPNIPSSPKSKIPPLAPPSIPTQ